MYATIVFLIRVCVKHATSSDLGVQLFCTRSRQEDGCSELHFRVQPSDVCTMSQSFSEQSKLSRDSKKLLSSKQSSFAATKK